MLSAVAAIALAGVALAFAGCTPEPASGPSDESLPEPTHAIVRIAEEWTVPPSLDADGAIRPGRYSGVNWRISAIDLETGEETIFAEESSAAVIPDTMPVLSPDGRQLLYGVPDLTGFVSYRSFGGSPGQRLYRLDLATGESVVACPQLVKSFGWDGEDIIATTWRGWLGGGGGFRSPPTNGVLRIAGSDVTTLVAEVPAGPWPPVDGPAPDGPTGQLEYLGADDGELYFVETSFGGGTFGGFNPIPIDIWRLRSGESSVSAAITLVGNYGGWAGQELTEPLETLLDRSMYATTLGEGLFPTHQYTVEQPTGFNALASATGVEASHTVVVHTARDMQAVGSFETTVTEPLPGQFVRPIYAGNLSRWLDQRRLGPPDVPEEGTWLCETDAASQETTALVLLNRSRAISGVLGYVGPELDVLYTSGDGRYGSAPPPRTVYLWERATAQSRVLAELEGSEHTVGVQIDLAGAAALE